jgi:hypothetical protein
MWRIAGVPVSLPEHVQVSENSDFLLIRCLQCRQSAWFSARGVSLAELTGTVEEHRSCPARAVIMPEARDAGDSRVHLLLNPLMSRMLPLFALLCGTFILPRCRKTLFSAMRSLARHTKLPHHREPLPNVRVA